MQWLSQILQFKICKLIAVILSRQKFKKYDSVYLQKEEEHVIG